VIPELAQELHVWTDKSGQQLDKPQARLCSYSPGAAPLRSPGRRGAGERSPWLATSAFGPFSLGLAVGGRSWGSSPRVGLGVPGRLRVVSQH